MGSYQRRGRVIQPKSEAHAKMGCMPRRSDTLSARAGLEVAKPPGACEIPHLVHGVQEVAAFAIMALAGGDAIA